MTPPLLSLRAVTKAFAVGDVVSTVLADVSFDVSRGEFLAIAGPSGCGKSTLLSILGLLDVPTTGTYVLDGERVDGFDAVARAHVRNRRIGFVFQAFNLIGDRTALENIELPLTYRGMSGEERRERAMRALERVGLADRHAHFPAQLSGGQQQRVAVARAVAGDPLILLADEPTGNLDSASGEAVMDLLGEMHQAGTTLCIVTHDPRYAERAHRTISLFDGRVVDDHTR
jgi:putative ABC transport system ATP-binding protein